MILLKAEDNFPESVNRFSVPGVLVEESAAAAAIVKFEAAKKFPGVSTPLVQVRTTSDVTTSSVLVHSIIAPRIAAFVKEQSKKPEKLTTFPRKNLQFIPSII
jgi:hypothetical protein